MRYRLLALAAGITAVSFAQTPAAAPKAAKATKTYTPPKTPWGDPDLQGNWPAQFNIPRDNFYGEADYEIGKQFQVERHDDQSHDCRDRREPAGSSEFAHFAAARRKDDERDHREGQLQAQYHL